MRPAARAVHGAADPLLAHALAEWGRSLGLSDFALDDHGQARLRLSQGRELTLAAQGSALRLQLSLPLPFEGPARFEQALAAAGVRQRGGGLQLGLRGRGADQVLLLGRWLPARQCSASVLARECERLLDGLELLQA